MSIKKYLPKKGSITNVQVKMETALVEKVKTRMKKDKINWNDFLRACFHAYLEETDLFEKKEDSVVMRLESPGE